jgi:hypothetical protein
MHITIRQALCTVSTLLLLVLTSAGQQKKKRKVSNVSSRTIQFIFTSDVHFGLTKENFRGQKNVPSYAVNAAMIAQMNRIPSMVFPADSGVNAGKKINFIDAIAITGDIANREENGVQSDAISWGQFLKDYGGLLRLKTSTGKRLPLLLTPGNHDASNAIGFHRPMQPLTDPSSVIGMYNLEMHPAIRKTTGNFNYQRDKVHYSLNLAGIHFMFVSLWPDSAERIWMAKDLAAVKRTVPVLLFTHSMPDVEARFFVNPNGSHDINDRDKFENLVTEGFKDGHSITDTAITEQRGFANFLRKHAGIKAYFHGHNNYTEFYDWTGPDHAVLLHCLRADSPMKGKYSSKDESKLSFIVVSIDPVKKILTAREFLWNRDASGKQNNAFWGAHVSISLN